MPSLWTHAVSMPDDWSLAGLLDEEEEELEESEGTRNKTFTRKLHKGLQERKSHAMERRSRAPEPARRYWPRALAFCIVLILTLTGAWAMLRYLQGRASQLLDSEGLAHPVQPAVRTGEAPTTAPRETLPAGPVIPVEKPAPAEKPSQPPETHAPAKVTVPAAEKPAQVAENPVQPVKPAQPVEKPASPVTPVQLEEKPAPPVKPAPVEAPTPPTEKNVPVRTPVPVAEKPAPVKKPEEPVLPLSYEGQVRLGTVALNNKRYDEALETFSQALERRKNDPRAWLGIVAAFEGRGAVGEAFRVLVDARNTLPRNPTIEVKLRDLQRRVK